MTTSQSPIGPGDLSQQPRAALMWPDLLGCLREPAVVVSGEHRILQFNAAFRSFLEDAGAPEPVIGMSTAALLQTFLAGSDAAVAVVRAALGGAPGRHVARMHILPGAAQPGAEVELLTSPLLPTPPGSPLHGALLILRRCCERAGPVGPPSSIESARPPQPSAPRGDDPPQRTESAIGGGACTANDDWACCGDQRLTATAHLQYLAHLVEASGDAVLTVDRSGVITGWNAGAERMYGHRTLDAVGRSVDLILPEDQRRHARERREASLAPGEVLTYESTRRTQDGRQLRVQVAQTPVANDAREPTGVMLLERDVTQRLATEDALREALQVHQRHLAEAQAVMRNMTDGLLVINGSGRIININPAARELYALPADVKPPLKLAEFREWFRIETIDGDALPSRAWPLARVMRGETFTGVEMRLTSTIDCSRCWFGSFSGTPVLDNEGNIVLGLVTVRDVSRRMRVERALRESEFRYRATFENAAVGIAHIAPDGRWTRVNGRLCEILGATRSDLLQARFQDITHTEDLAAEVEAFDAMNAGRSSGYQIEKRFRRTDGTPVWTQVTVAMQRDDDGDGLFAIAIVQDISERRQAQEALRESEQRFRNMADSAPVLIWIADSRGHCTWVNQQWLEFTGRTLEECIGDGWVDDVHPDDRASCLGTGRAAREQRASFEAQYRLRRSDGAYRWMLDRGAPRFTDRGEPAGYIGSCIDITARVHAEEQLRLLTAELSHRVKNTLATILSISSQTLRNVDSLPQFKEAFEGRLRALAHTHGLLSAQHWGGTQLSQIVAAVLEPFNGGGEEGRLVAHGDALEVPPKVALTLTLALHELATNALKYGALSNATGKVDVCWGRPLDPAAPLNTGAESVSPSGWLDIRWVESGGPPVKPPNRKGFGCRLFDRTVSYDLGGSVDLTFRPEGVQCLLRIPLHPQPPTRSRKNHESNGELP